jgi:hypothetical protein
MTRQEEKELQVNYEYSVTAKNHLLPGFQRRLHRDSARLGLSGRIDSDEILFDPSSTRFVARAFSACEERVP